ncbi:retrovirus-related pol polyprotein from transposon TNT 1-94 [Tanacetum coccineum]
MDPIIPIRQRNTLVEYMILSGADNRPPMLDKDLYDSWKSIMELYIQNRKNRRMILESVEHGLLIWPTIKENGVIRTKKYVELSATEKIQTDCDMKAINIILQGLPTDIYSLNKFVTHVKLVKDLHTTNFDQLHAYLEQHELHANEVRLMREHRTRANTLGTRGNYSGQQRVMKCFNCQGEGHMARQCPKPKRKRDAMWFREKVLFFEAQGNGKVLNEEEFEFLADTGIAEAKAVLMANLSSYGSDVLSEDTNSSAQQDALILSMFEQLSNQVTNCNKVNNDNLIANETLSAELERYKERVKLLEERQNVDLGTQEKLIIDDIIQEKNAQFADFEKEINNLKQTLSEQSKEKELLTKTFNVFKNESKEKEAKNIDTKIALEKKVKELDNIVCKMGQSTQTVHMLTKPQVFYDNNLKQALGFQNPFYLKKAQQIRPMLYDGNVIAKETNVISIADSEETLMLEEESRSKMLLKQSDPMVLEKKVNIKPINYDGVNRLSEILVNMFVPQEELGLMNSSNLLRPICFCLLKLRLLGNFLRKQFFIENDRILDQIISQDIVNIVVNSFVDVNTFVKVNSSVVVNDSVNYVEMCNKCLKLEAELIKQHKMVEKDKYNRLSKRFSELKQHCISLEFAMQLNKEIFQKNNTSVNQTEPSFNQLFELNNLKVELQAKDITIEKLKANIKRLNNTSTTNNVNKDIDEIKTINIELEHRVTKLIAENEHLKQTYKQLYDSIKPSRIHVKEQTESLVNQLNQKSVEITDLNAQLQEKVFVITALNNDLRKFKGKDIVDNVAQVSNTTTSAPGMYKLDLLIQELLGYVRDTFPDIQKPSEKFVAVTPINKKKTVRFADNVTSSCNIIKVTNRPILSSTRVNPSTSASGSKPSGNTKNDRILRTPSSNEKNKVEVQYRKVKSSLNKRNYESKNVCNEHVKHPVKGAKALCSVCNECLFDANHAMCLIDHVNSINVRAKFAFKKNKKGKEWKPTGKVVPIPLEVVAPTHVVTRVYTMRPKVPKSVPNSKHKVAKSMTANRMEPDTSRGSDTLVAPSYSSLIDCRLSKLFYVTTKLRRLWGGDYQIGNVIISRVYYVEGLGHNLFSIGQFCDSDLEVAFRKHTCFVCNLEGVDLLSGSRGTNLYSLSIKDMMASSPICLLSKATKTKTWLWHRRLSHLNFGAINHLARHDLVRGLPRLKFEKDHLCSACAMGKIKKQSHKPKFEDTNQEKLYLLHMDLCGPMRVASVNGKKYILVIVFDYSRFTWVKFLALKDEAPDFIIKFLKMMQVRLNATVRNIRTDNGTEFVNKTLRDYYEQVGISHEISVARTPQQNCWD